jgi:ribosomal protein L11 methyltransferase
MAVQNAHENAARNGMSEPQIAFIRGDLTKDITGRYDVIVSNIVADAIVSLAPCIRDFLKPGGVWISAGIIDTRADEVLAALQKEGFDVVAQHSQEGWVCLVAN